MPTVFSCSVSHRARHFFVGSLITFGMWVGTAVANDPAEAAATDDSSATKPAISFANDVQPILEKHCLGCHQPAKPQGGYVMTEFEPLLRGGDTGDAAIVAGDPDASYLLDLITPTDGVAEMPQDADPLHEVEIEVIRKWIAEGAQNDLPESTGPVYSAENPPVYRRLPSIASLDASPDGKLIAVTGFHEVLLLNADDGSQVHRLIGMSQRLESVRFSPDGKRVAVAGGTPGRLGEIQVWNVGDGALELSKRFTYDTLRGLSWSPDGSMIAFGATDNVIRAIDSVTGEQELFQGAHEDWVLGTTFTGDGSHIISVGRDMTCKLTETETERFVDNITSITPGALTGGLTSVQAIPGRNEILFGGADGVAKVYRVFRETARQIGDDANLIRKLPGLEGRIFAVGVSADASRLAAVATLDGKSQLRVWKTREVIEMPADIKAIHAKRVSQRNAEEKKKLAAFVTPESEELVAVDLPVASYAVCFLPDNALAVGADDGRVRIYATDGQLRTEFELAPVVEDAGGKLEMAYQPQQWKAELTKAAEKTTGDAAVAPDSVVALHVEPAEQIEFADPFDYVQVLVTAELNDGRRIDVTRDASFDPSANVMVSADGLVMPLARGDGKIEIAFAGQSHTVPVVTPEVAVAQPQVDFIRDVNPVLSKLGCNQGTCHGAQKGKNGFRLSLRGYDPIFDVRALTDDLSGRRVNLASPTDSLILLKSLGRVPHEGGALVDVGSPYHGILEAWVAQGTSLDLQSSKANRIEVFPKNPIVQRADAAQQVRVVAYYPDGSQRDVTREAFVESGNTEVAAASKTGLLTAIRRGEAPILARYEGNYAATTLTVMGDRGEFAWQEVETYGTIDELVANKWQRMKILPSGLADDATFIRRVYLDLTGLPPTAEQVREFLADERPTREKRAELVDALIGSPAYVDYWTNKWADLLQVNRKFLGVEGSKAFHEWIETAVAENKPYDEFAREILTSTGSNKDNPPASYYKILRNAEDVMENTTHLFLGVRFNCNKCHDHPFERWTQDQYYQTAAFFAKTKLKADPASGDKRIGGTAVEGAKPLYEEVFDAEAGEIVHPTTGDSVAPEFPFACDFEVDEGASDRERLAAWITSADNQYFARSYVNRLWGYLLGVGLIEPIDDIRAGNPPTNPELLDYLAEEFIAHDFDPQHVMRLICNSRTYQLEVATNRWNEDDQINYSHAVPRRLPAEVLYDAIHFVTGSKPAIPGVPEGTRAAQLPDAGVNTPDGFLANLGRPVRESACECERSSDLQLGPVMALVSGPTVGSAISDDKNVLAELVTQIEEDEKLADELFVRILNRPPSDEELQAFLSMIDLIEQDHAALKQTLDDREAWWSEEKPKLESQRQAELAKSQEELEKLKQQIQPERDRLEQERQARIAAAKAEVDAARSSLLERRVPEFESQFRSGAEWIPLRAASATSTNGATFQSLEDRSIMVAGKKEKATYEIKIPTRMTSIKGFRLEALPVADLKGGGPGFPENGNFVVTEFEVFAKPLGSEEAPKLVKIAKGSSSFNQSGFDIAQTFDGKPQDQKGWAVSPAGGVVHWATFQLQEAIAFEPGVELTVKIHQYHNAADHRLAHFRISATQHDGGDIGLSLPESFASIVSLPNEQRTEEVLKPLVSYLEKADGQLRAASDKFNVANAAVPPDARVTAMERTIAELSKPIPDDGTLLQLRTDFEQSQKQLDNRRLTAAEDLTWALINSPAFLFNH